VIVMMRAEQLVGLLHKIAMRLNLLPRWPSTNPVGRNDIEMHRNRRAWVQIDALEEFGQQISANRPACSTARL